MPSSAANVVERADVGMIQARYGACLALEPLAAVGLFRQTGRHIL